VAGRSTQSLGVTVRHLVTFEAEIAGAAAGSVDGSAPPPGRPIADMLASAVQQSGLKITKPVSQFAAYGWAFAVGDKAASVECMLQRSDEWLLMCNPQRPPLSRIFRRPSNVDLQAVTRAIDGFLHAHPSVQGVRWYTRDEFHSKQSGHDHPWNSDA